MKKYSLVLLALATALAISPAAMASTFNYTITGFGSGAGDSGSITISGLTTGIPGETGDYNISSGSGSFVVNGFSFSGSIVANTASGDSAGPGYGNNDNNAFWFADVLNPTDGADGYIPQVADTTAGAPPSNLVSGILFSISGAGNFSAGNPYVYLLLSDPSGVDYLTLGDAAGDTSSSYSVTLMSATPTPEPSSLLFMGTGLLLMAGLLFRRKSLQGIL